MRGRCYKFGDDIPHAECVIPQWTISGRHFDPDELIPLLFEGLRPGFHEQVKPGDVIVTGKNFGMGPKMNGYIAMHALGLGLVCESMPFLAYRAALGTGLKVFDECPDVTKIVEDGDEIEVDFSSGLFMNHTQKIEKTYPPIPKALHEFVELGGSKGWLQKWWADKKSTRASA
jgi:3-isopropylmalate/(R)-2-methylmalate dehydratase small subunit